MKNDRPARIPIPLRQRWVDARLRIIPAIVFIAAVGGIGFLWNDYVAAPTMVGQAEPVLSNVSSHKTGILAELHVNRFQRVKAGQAIGRVMVADPRLLSATIASIQAQIEMLRAEHKPIVAQQRAAMDLGQLRLDWMRDRARLATARVNLQLAESELTRTSELFKEKIVAERVYEQAKANRDMLQAEIEDLQRLVTATEVSLQELQVTNMPDISKVTDAPLQAAIAVHESELRKTEAELSPVDLTAPIDGIVSTVYHRSGEAVTAGAPIVSIATLEPVRIVGYLRPPIQREPQIGMKVEVRTRGMRRQSGWAEVLEVGTQLEQVPVGVLGPAKLVGAETALLVDIAVPHGINIRPGEMVDLILRQN